MAEPAGYDNRIKVRKFSSPVLEEHRASGIHCGLCPHDIVEVYLGEHYVPLDPGFGRETEHVFHPAVSMSEPCRSLFRGKSPVPVDRLRHKEVRNKVDKSRAADPDGALPSDRQYHRLERDRV